MAWKIKNLKLALLSLVLFCIFINLGTWQLRRSDEKQLLLKSYNHRAHHSPLKPDNLLEQSDLRFYRAKLVGTFDNEHTILLDNKTHHGKIGYEVYTPFRATGFGMPILVDRGFVQNTGSRAELPTIPAITEETTIVGLINEPPRYAAMGEMVDGQNQWPLRVEFINLPKLGEKMNAVFFPYVLALDPKHAAALDLQWEIVLMSPERHQGYALQWFAFALTLLVLFATLNIGRVD